MKHGALVTRLGHFPERVPLAVTFGDRYDEGEYTRTLVTYMVEAQEKASAWLLTPKGEIPPGGRAAILALHQHAGQYELGKSEPAGISGNPLLHYGRNLCQRGYIVLCPDQLCFEDRRPAPTTQILDGFDYERFAFTQRLLSGSCLQTKHLHDLSCALDVLISLPDVNSAHVGAIGHSFGGQEALWLAWYDARVTAAVSSCGFGLLRTLLRDGINHNFGMYIPGMLEICDMDDMVASLAPRAFCLIAGETDPIVPIDGVREIVARAQKVYTQQGVPERFHSILFPDGHVFPQEAQENAYTFLDHYLKC